MKLQAFGSGDPTAVNPSATRLCAAQRSEAALQGVLPVSAQSPKPKASLRAAGGFLQGRVGLQAQQLLDPSPLQALPPPQVCAQTAAGPSAP